MPYVLVAPPPQRLYFGQTIRGPQDRKDDECGSTRFRRFFDMDRLRNHRGLHIMSMEDFLETEAVHGKLKGGKLPPGNKTDGWGRDLWGYFEKVALAPSVKNLPCQRAQSTWQQMVFMANLLSSTTRMWRSA